MEEVKNKGGRPTLQFNKQQRNEAEVLAGVGLPHRQIAILIGCSEESLRKYFGPELAIGDAKATARIAQTLYNKAIQGDTASLIFWMKARAGWKESSVHEHTHNINPDHMTDAQLLRIAAQRIDERSDDISVH